MKIGKIKINVMNLWLCGGIFLFFNGTYEENIIMVIFSLPLLFFGIVDFGLDK